MKKIYFLFLLFGCSQLIAQQTANLVLFSEGGEPFYASVNNIRQNETASANVKITGLTSEFINVKIEFEDPALGSFDRNLSLMFGYELTGQLKMNKKGNYVIRPFGEPVAISQASQREDDQPVIIYHEEPYTEMEHRPAPVKTPVKPQPPTTIVHTEEVHTTPGTIDVDVDMPGIQMDVTISEEDMLDGTVQTHTTYTTTTTTTTTTTERPTQTVIYEPVYEEEEEVVYEPLVPGYNGPIGCGDYLMSDQPFRAAVQSINSKSFEDDKMTVAKQISRNQCLTTAQVKEVMSLFTFEASKLEWAKLAYDRTYDIGNYWMLNDGFTFSSSIDELDSYIQTRR